MKIVKLKSFEIWSNEKNVGKAAHRHASRYLPDWAVITNIIADKVPSLKGTKSKYVVDVYGTSSENYFFEGNPS